MTLLSIALLPFLLSQESIAKDAISSRQQNWQNEILEMPYKETKVENVPVLYTTWNVIVNNRQN